MLSCSPPVEFSSLGSLVQSPPFVHIKANFKKGVLYLNTKIIGNYNFENILAAACVANHFDVDPLKIQKALEEYQPDNNRSQLITKGDLRIIMDAYNANPTSMQASIKSFIADNEGKKYLLVYTFSRSNSETNFKNVILGKEGKVIKLENKVPGDFSIIEKN